MKRSRPRAEPSGIPQESGRGCELWLEALTEKIDMIEALT